MRRIFGIFVILLIVALWANESRSAAIGSVVEQEGVTSVERQGEESDLEEGSDVEFMDTVKTGKGNLGITFIDDTNVAVSAQSSLVIDDFVYDPNNADNSKLALKVAAGTVRYASGNVAKLAKQNVDIRTPTAKILVRGTAFSMTVDEIGQSLIILLPNVDGTVGEIDEVAKKSSTRVGYAACRFDLFCRFAFHSPLHLHRNSWAKCRQASPCQQENVSRTVTTSAWRAL